MRLELWIVECGLEEFFSKVIVLVKEFFCRDV